MSWHWHLSCFAWALIGRAVPWSSETVERLPRSLPGVLRMGLSCTLKRHFILHCTSCVHKIQIYTGSPENHTAHSVSGHSEISLYIYKSYRLVASVERGISRKDWPEGKIVRPTAVPEVTRSYLVSIIYSFTSISGDSAISILQFQLPRDLILCYMIYCLLLVKRRIGKHSFLQ